MTSYYEKTDSTFPFLDRLKYSQLELDLLILGVSIFQLEKLLKEKQITEVDIPLYGDYDYQKLENFLEFLVSSSLNKQINIKITKRESKSVTQSNLKKFNSVCLFSGGADSFSSLTKSKDIFKSVASVFTQHNDQGKLKNAVQRIENEILKKKGIKINYVPSVSHGGGWMPQTRGFLYVLNGAVFCKTQDNSSIIVSECGPTMFQPRLSPMDITTLTSHPVILKITKGILQECINKKVRLIKPNENLTKAEIIASCPDKYSLKFTHSCITTRHAGNPVSHCGKCYGCIVRRLSFLVAGVEDTSYHSDTLVNGFSEMMKKSSKIYQGVDNIINLMWFSHKILLDYDSITDFMKESIKEYKKEELFRRFALDVFSGLHLLYDIQKIGKNIIIRKMYENLKNKIGKDILQNRIGEVRENKFKPDFNNFVE